MSKISFKKLSVAAAVAFLGLGVSTQAATIYTTGFEASETPAFTPGKLAGQGNFVDLNGAADGTGTIVTGTAQSGSQSAQINSSTAGFSEFYSTTTAVPAATINGGTLTASFGLERAMPGTGQTTGGQPQGGTGAAEAGFGIEVLNNTNTAVLASVFVRNTAPVTSGINAGQPSVAALFVSNSSQSPNTEIFGPTGTAAGDNSYGSYSLSLNFATQMFTVTGPGGTSAPFAFASSYNGNGIGAVTLSATNEGNDTAFFDNFSVAAGVPEPVSIGMVTMGSLLLMGRRRKQNAI